MLSKSQVKYIKSLGLKKFREQHGTFVAEGNKLVTDLLPYFECELLVAAPSWMATQGDLHPGELVVAGNGDIPKASFLKTPQDVLAVFRQPETDLTEADPSTQLILALDGVQDPGNLGTIVRLADWFGIGHIVCSPDTADVFGPKAVQATMGALARVKVHYTPLAPYLKESTGPVYGTFLEGETIYTHPLSATGVILMGNEGNGIRPETAQAVTHKIHIPNYPPERATSESLNVAIATAVVCSEFRRRAGR